MNLLVLGVLLIAKMEFVLRWDIPLYKMEVKYLESTSYTPQQAHHFVVNMTYLHKKVQKILGIIFECIKPPSCLT